MGISYTNKAAVHAHSILGMPAYDAASVLTPHHKQGENSKQEKKLIKLNKQVES